ncbi:hypothetical protein [Methyloversatilis universalis]|uniref:hypothetical protein n=1 Tax=Methyloversatilis universalis TaxID=378211 RepID=UPI00037A8FEA|nr:hypothetical protein [Methyloversatilis universalis]
MRTRVATALGLVLLAGCAPMKPQPPGEPAAGAFPPATRPEAARPAPSKKAGKPLPIPARALQAKADCSYRDDIGTEGRLVLDVKDSKVERFASDIDMGRRGRCSFDLAAFTQTRFDHTPTLVAGACTVSLWEQKDEVTVSYRNCAAHCTPGAHDYLWPTLVSRKTGNCR